MSEAKEKVAAITRYTTRESFMQWLIHRGVKFDLFQIQIALRDAKKNDFILWTSKSGLRII